MTDGKRNVQWKLTAIGMAFAIGSALETGLVVAQWTGKPSDQKVAEVGQVCAALGGGGSATAESPCSVWPVYAPVTTGVTSPVK